MSTHQINFTGVATVSHDFLIDVAICAVEGGIGYWSQVSDYDCDEGTATIHDSAEADGSVKIYALSPALVLEGIRLFVSGPYVEAYRLIVLGCILADDASDIDSDIADLIVQIACFGQVVYG